MAKTPQTIETPQPILALTEIVPDLIWASDFFGPREIWSPRNFGPKNVGPNMKMPYNDFHARTKFLGAQISWSPNFLGPKFCGAQMRLGTISVYCHALNT